MSTGVTLIDGDQDTIDAEYSDIMLPRSTDWRHAIEYVAATFPLSLVVAHRESIRNMAQRHLKTPYCCYGIFHFYDDTPYQYEHSILRSLHRPCGQPIDIGSQPPPRPGRERPPETVFTQIDLEIASDSINDLFGAESV